MIDFQRGHHVSLAIDLKHLMPSAASFDESNARGWELERPRQQIGHGLIGLAIDRLGPDPRFKPIRPQTHEDLFAGAGVHFDMNPLGHHGAYDGIDTGVLSHNPRGGSTRLLKTQMTPQKHSPPEADAPRAQSPQRHGRILDGPVSVWLIYRVRLSETLWRARHTAMRSFNSTGSKGLTM